MTSSSNEAIRKLASSDNTSAFDCGNLALNHFLQRFALTNQAANSAQTYVSCQDDAVAGFFSLTVGSVSPEDAAARVLKGMARHPVPVMILARLAVDLNHQGSGLGAALLKNALTRTAQAAEIAGIRALLVHSKDDAARNWYLNFGFEPSQTNPLRLFMLLKNIKAGLNS